MRKTVVLQPITPTALTSGASLIGDGISLFSYSSSAAPLASAAASWAVAFVSAPSSPPCRIFCVVYMMFGVNSTFVQSFGILYKYSGIKLMSMLCTDSVSEYECNALSKCVSRKYCAMKNGPVLVVSISGTKLGMCIVTNCVTFWRLRSVYEEKKWKLMHFLRIDLHSIMFCCLSLLPRSVDLILFSINFNFNAPIFFAPKSRSDANRARAAGISPLVGWVISAAPVAFSDGISTSPLICSKTSLLPSGS